MTSLLASNAEPSAARKALTAVVLAALLLAAVVVQLTVVNRLPLPGGAAPDLVLLVVTAIAVCTTPLAGALAGFAGGLALDVAPPAIHYAGEYALVFCLAGWGAARVNRAIRDARGERDPMVAFAVMAGAAAAGEAGKAALGMMLSDPDVTGVVASRLLPTAVLYDLLVAPFAFWLVARVTRGADPERAPAPEFSVEQRLAQGFRSASAGAALGLRLAGTGENYNQPPAAGRTPRLRLASGRGGSGIATGAAAPGGAAGSLGGGRTPRLSFGGDLPAQTGQGRAGARGPRTPGKNWLRGATGMALAGSPALKVQTAAAARRGARGPGRGWLTAAGQAGLGEPGAQRASRTPGEGWITAARPAAKRTSRAPGGGWLRLARPGGPGGGLAAGTGGPRSGAEALAARSAPSGLSALSGGGTPMAAGGFRRGRALSASAFRGPRAGHRDWHAAAPSSGWLRRSRHPWRKRSQRLLRLVGVRR